MLWTVREKNYGNRDHVLMCECSRVPDIIIIKEILTSKSTWILKCTFNKHWQFIIFHFSLKVKADKKLM